MEKLIKITIYSVICGIILTLVTFLRGQPIGGGPIGFPFPWLHSTVLPSNSGYTFDWTGLISDILIWSVISFAVLFVLFRKKK
jgi:hypothetical protein